MRLRDALARLGLPELERVEVRDHDPRLAEVLLQVGGDEVAELVVVLLVLGQQHAEPVPDRQARGDDQEPPGEPGVVRAGRLVQRLPGDQHRHHDGLAAAGGHLQRRPGSGRALCSSFCRSSSFRIQVSPAFCAASAR